MKNINLTLALRGSSCRALIDGVDISPGIFGVDVTHRIGEIPTVTLHAPVQEVVHLDGVAEVVVPADTETALVQIGWKTPDDYARVRTAANQLLDTIAGMAIRNTDVDAAAATLTGALADAEPLAAAEPVDVDQAQTARSDA